MIRRPTEEQMQPVEALRVQIADVQNQVRAVMALPPSADELARRVEVITDKISNSWELRIFRQELLSASFNPAAAAMALNDLPPSGIAVISRAAMVNGLIALGGNAEGISNEARSVRLSELNRTLDRLEREEEALLDVLEADSYVVQRRDNARPEIVLGL